MRKLRWKKTLLTARRQQANSSKCWSIAENAIVEMKWIENISDACNEKPVECVDATCSKHLLNTWKRINFAKKTTKLEQKKMTMKPTRNVEYKQKQEQKRWRSIQCSAFSYDAWRQKNHLSWHNQLYSQAMTFSTAELLSNLFLFFFRLL